ncbi:MAG: hypothetical protein HW421_3933 [Ignavibacteria bacterium]|nr:hypothetical protein [Ignavibacteria bacterium]
MRPIKLDSDIQPLTEFRANTAFYIKQINVEQRPLVLTQHGKSVAVMLNVKDYEDLIEKSEMINDIKIAESQIDRGLGINHQKVIREIKRNITG